MTEREILFRGQTRRKNDCAKMPSSNWVYGGIFIPNDKCNYAIIIAQQESAVEKHSVYGDTVGQYTGLADKNGVKIFEGDIVRYCDTIHKVVFEQRNDTAYFGLVYSEVETMPFGHYQDLTQIEVIGNIYDDPELLEIAAKPAAKNIAQSGLAPATENFELMEG